MKIIKKVKENKNKIKNVAIGMAIAGVSYTVGKVVGYNGCMLDLKYGINKIVEAVPEFKDQYMEALDKAFNENNG